MKFEELKNLNVAFVLDSRFPNEVREHSVTAHVTGGFGSQDTTEVIIIKDVAEPLCNYHIHDTSDYASFLNECVFAGRAEAEMKLRVENNRLATEILEMPREKFLNALFTGYMGDGPWNQAEVEALRLKFKQEFGVDV